MRSRRHAVTIDSIITSEFKTLQETIIYFSDQDRCLEYFKAIRWPNGIVTCPACDRDDVLFLKNQRTWRCKSVHPKRQFTIKVGTIFEESRIGLDKWLIALWMVANCKNGISSYDIGRALGVTQKAAWLMLQRLRLAMQSGSLMTMGGSGPVEVDENHTGGKARRIISFVNCGTG